MNQIIMANQDNNVSVLTAIHEAPEELLWKANFNSDNSVATYDKAIRVFSGFLGISFPEELRELTHAHVIAFKKFLQGRGNNPRTINNRLSAISSLFNHLIDQQVVKINVAQALKECR